MRTLNIDLDGVVYPWHEVMAEWVWTAQTGTEWNPYEIQSGFVWEDKPEWFLPYPAPTKWDFEAEWALKPAEFYSLFRKGVEAGYVWRAGEPLSGAVSALWKLDEDDWYIRLVTKRLVHKFSHATIMKATAEWLDRWNVPYHEIVLMGQHSEKGQFACDLALDDNPKHIREYQKASIRSILLQRPWNGSPGKMSKVQSWEGFLDLAARHTLQDREPQQVSSHT